MTTSRRAVALLILATLLIPLTASQIYSRDDERGGYDHAGEWQPRHALEIHDGWWNDWSRDSNLWKGRAVVNGRITKSITNVKLTANQIKKQIGLKLTSEEHQREKEFKANA